MDATIQIHEQELAGQKIYHWQILDEGGNEFSRSAYHTDRDECEREAKDRLNQCQAEGWL